MIPATAPVLILGSGPAGCSCALWLSQMGLPVLLLEQESRLLPRLHALDLPQNWVLGEHYTSTRTLAERYATHLQQQANVAIRCGTSVQTVLAWDPGAIRLGLTDGSEHTVRAVVLAAGLRAVPAPAWVSAEAPCWDAAQLTAQRRLLPASRRILLLGGGDNAVENAYDLCQMGHRVTLWSRGPLRAQPVLSQRLQRLKPEQFQARVGQPMPQQVTAAPAGDGCLVRSAAYGDEHFDHVALLFGFEPDPAAWAMLAHAAGLGDADRKQPVSDPSRGLFVAGDAARRGHPCIQTALGDGVQVARAVASVLNAPSQPVTAPPNSRTHVLQLTGLRFDASLGILEAERVRPQPIQVDAELCLGRQPLLPSDDDIHRVLDYRKVRQIIIDECTAEHVNLLETLIGRLAHRLLQLPGVLGVRVRIAKLEIFADCEVAIRVETGQWS